MSYCIYCTVCTNVSKIKAIHLLICKREISAISASLSQIKEDKNSAKEYPSQLRATVNQNNNMESLAKG